MTDVTFPAVLTKINDQVKVEFPDLPDAFAQGDSADHALANAKLSLALVVIDKQTHFEAIPAASDLETVKKAHPENEVLEIHVNLDDY